MTNAIREKLYNIDLIISEIKEFPQTYDTILGEAYNDGTCQAILRRKINILCKDGEIYKTTIPGTRFGKVIFYFLPKKYNILFEGGRTGTKVYIFFEYEKAGRYYIKIKPYWELENRQWIKKKEKIIFEGNVLKWL